MTLNYNRIKHITIKRNVLNKLNLYKYQINP